MRLRNFISEFSHDRIVLISTHIVSDIEYISTRNAITVSYTHLGTSFLLEAMQYVLAIGRSDITDVLTNRCV